MGFIPITIISIGGSTGGSTEGSVIVTSTPPTNTSLIWIDNSVNPVVWKKYNTQTSIWEIINVGDGDINDSIESSENTTWSSEQILERNSFEFTQIEPSLLWIIEHPLKRYPSVVIMDSNNDQIIGNVIYISNSVIHIEFDIPISGKAYLN
jgi:tellurite resistance-related uncharacterized protein